MKRLLFPLITVVATSTACVEENAAIYLTGVLPVRAPACSAQAGGGVYHAIGALDIGSNGAQDANPYTAAIEVATNLPATFSTQELSQEQSRQPNYPNYGNADANVFIFDAVDVFFEQDSFENGQPVPLDGNVLPTRANPRRTSIGGSLYNEQTGLNAQTPVFVPLVTPDEAVRMQNIAYTLNLSGNPDATARITAKVRVVGHTLGGATEISPWFGYPIELCVHCLSNVGWEGEIDANGNKTCPIAGEFVQPVVGSPGCFEGQDFVTSACQPVVVAP
jgi:hypothetical protein